VSKIFDRSELRSNDRFFWGDSAPYRHSSPARPAMTASRSLHALSLIASVALACVDMVACATYDGQTGYLGTANRDT